MITAVHTSHHRGAGLLPALARFLGALPRRPRADGREADDTRDALVRALCHDMRGPLASLASALSHLDDSGRARPELLALAQAQTDQLTSMLRTVEASGDGPARRPLRSRPLHEIVASSVAACGLPREQLTVRIAPAAADVAVGDARLQRILWNLLENAHRHGNGAPVALDVVRESGWVQLSVTQSGLTPARVVDHLSAPQPPMELTGLGLWSVQRQTRELGGRVLWEDDGSALTLRILLPDH